jgi:hypothetical protein
MSRVKGYGRATQISPRRIFDYDVYVEEIPEDHTVISKADLLVLADAVLEVHIYNFQRPTGTLKQCDCPACQIARKYKGAA